jgi:hypothetical protein
MAGVLTVTEAEEVGVDIIGCVCNSAVDSEVFVTEGTGETLAVVNVAVDDDAVPVAQALFKTYCVEPTAFVLVFEGSKSAILICRKHEPTDQSTATQSDDVKQSARQLLTSVVNS